MIRDFIKIAFHTQRLFPQQLQSASFSACVSAIAERQRLRWVIPRHWIPCNQLVLLRLIWDLNNLKQENMLNSNYTYCIWICILCGFLPTSTEYMPVTVASYNSIGIYQIVKICELISSSWSSQGLWLSSLQMLLLYTWEVWFSQGLKGDGEW